MLTGAWPTAVLAFAVVLPPVWTRHCKGCPCLMCLKLPQIVAPDSVHEVLLRPYSRTVPYGKLKVSGSADHSFYSPFVCPVWVHDGVETSKDIFYIFASPRTEILVDIGSFLGIQVSLGYRIIKCTIVVV